MRQQNYIYQGQKAREIKYVVNTDVLFEVDHEAAGDGRQWNTKEHVSEYLATVFNSKDVYRDGWEHRKMSSFCKEGQEDKNGVDRLAFSKVEHQKTRY